MIETVPLFPPLHRELIALLRGLSAEEWSRPTIAGRRSGRAWTVKEVASHLLDGMWRRLAAGRDGHQLPPDRPLDSPAALAAFVDGLNADWIRASARLSPRLLTKLLERAGVELAEYFATLDGEAEALWPVSWAGETLSRNWMDVGRDYTEQWHHQQQIRLATGRPLQLDRRFGRPALALFVRALPAAYGDTGAESGAAPGAEIEIAIGGEAGGRFILRRGPERAGWSLGETAEAAPAVRIEIADADAWRLFTKGLEPDEARAAIRASGRQELLAPFLRTLAIVG